MPDPTNAPAPAPAAHAITVEPVISFARRARPGARCVLTVDLRHDCSPENWPYSDEEYELRCVLDARPLFSHKAVGDAAVVLHRYGGSYGPATFVLTASSEEMTGSIRIALVNRAGLLAETLELKDIRIARGAEPPPAQSTLRLQEQTVIEPAANAPLQQQTVREPEPNAPLQQQAASEPAPDAPWQQQAIREPAPDAPLQQQAIREPAPNAPLQEQTVREPAPNERPKDIQAPNAELDIQANAETTAQEPDLEKERGGIPLADLRRFVQQCDIHPLDPEDPRYVDLDVARGEGHRSLGKHLGDTIAFSASPTIQLVCGQPGTGLTSELLRLRTRIRGARDLPYRVVHVDFEMYGDVYSPVDVTDVLRTIAFCLDVEATKLESGSPEGAMDYLPRLYSILEQVDFPHSEELREARGTSFLLGLRGHRAERERVTRIVQSHLTRFMEETMESMARSVARIERSLGEGQVVVVVDGLGKLTALREQDRPEIERAVKSLFGAFGQHLRLPCHVVYTAPLWLRYRPATVVIAGEPRVLPHIQLFALDGEPHFTVDPALLELMRRRIDVGRVFGDSIEETLFPLLKASGGCLRDALRMVRDVMIATKALPIDRAVVERTIGKHSEAFGMTLRAPDIDILARLARERTPWAEPYTGRFTRLLEKNAILLRRTGELELYDIHPLLYASREVGPALRAAGVR